MGVNLFMYMRVTHFKMKPDAVAGAMAKAEGLKDQIMGLPGVVRFLNSINEDGTGCVVSINESKAQSEANSAAVQGIWANFADDLAAPPEVSGYEIGLDWSN